MGLLDFMTGRPEDYGNRRESVDEYTKRTLLDPNIVERGSILPFGKTKDGEVDWWTTPEFAVDAMKAFVLPSHVMRGGSYGVDDAVNASLELMGGGLLSSKAIPNAVPSGEVLGTFAGTGSKLADRQLLKKAKSLLSKKSPKDRIWDEDTYRATGWYKDIDGKWKFEIDDSKVNIDKDNYKFFRLSPEFENVQDYVRKVQSDELPVEEMFGRDTFMPRSTGYPNIDEGAVFRLPTQGNVLGEMHPNYPMITGVAIPPRGRRILHPLTRFPLEKYGDVFTMPQQRAVVRDSLLHEGQHHIDFKEKHGMGSSPELYEPSGILELPTPTPKDMDRIRGLKNIEDLLNEKLSWYGDRGKIKDFYNIYGDQYKKLDEDLLKEKLRFDPDINYYHSLGEANARNVEARSLLSPPVGSSSRPLPWKTLDVRRENITSMTPPQFMKKYRKWKEKQGE